MTTLRRGGILRGVFPPGVVEYMLPWLCCIFLGFPVRRFTFQHGWVFPTGGHLWSCQSPAVEENCHRYQGSSAGKPFTDFLPPLCYSHLESASPRINDLRYYIHMNHKLDIVHRSQGQLQPHVFSALTKYLRT